MLSHPAYLRPGAKLSANFESGQPASNQANWHINRPGISKQFAIYTHYMLQDGLVMLIAKYFQLAWKQDYIYSDVYRNTLLSMQLQMSDLTISNFSQRRQQHSEVNGQESSVQRALPKFAN